MTENYFNPLEKLNKFILPNKTIFSVGALEKVQDELEQFDKSKIFLITDKVIKETTPARKFITLLSSSGFEVKIFESEIKEPTVDMLNDFVDFIGLEKDAIVMGLGGGSIMDQAKVASILATNEGKVEDFVGQEKVQNDGLPLVLIPTTAGTGAETSKNAVLKGKDKKLVVSSLKILPDLAIIDPILTLSLPPRPTAFTGMDALSHAIESIISLNCNPLVMAMSLEVISLVNENLPLAYFSGYNIQARYNMSLAATLAGFSLNGGAVLAHSVSYTLDHFNVPHGLGCAIALPQVIRFNAPVIPEKMKRMARALGLNDDRINDPIKTASFVVNTVSRLNSLFNIPLSLKSMGIDKEKSKELAEECFTKFPRPNNPRTYSKKDLIVMYEDLWSGELEIQ